MIELGEISINDKTSLVEARNKIRILAEELKFDSITATRMATTSSEISRQTMNTGQASSIKLALDKRGGRYGLVLQFITQGRPSSAVSIALLQTVFDYVEVSQIAGGSESINNFKFLHDPEFKPTDEFIDRAMAIIQHLTSEELVKVVKLRTTELEAKTVELEQANIRLQEVDRLKSVFLASMSHELRTPLNSIIGFTGIIVQGMSGEINPEQRKQLTMVKNSANHLLSLINDVLDISRIEAGRVELTTEEMRLDDVVKEVVEAFSPMADEKGLELVTSVPQGITLHSDKRRVKQVLMNLVSNAVKFTSKGSVKLAGRVLGAGKLEIKVTDTGIGIEEEDMNRLFQPFQQVGPSFTKHHEGTGLGLHLTRRLCDLLGGDISAKSQYGQGSEFTFTIPLRYKG